MEIKGDTDFALIYLCYYSCLKETGCLSVVLVQKGKKATCVKIQLLIDINPLYVK